MDIVNAQWEVIQQALPKVGRTKDRRGRPQKDLSAVVNGIFWICRTGARWKDLPSCYPPYQTCHRYFQLWVKAGIWDKVL